MVLVYEDEACKILGVCVEVQEEFDVFGTGEDEVTTEHTEYTELIEVSGEE